MPEDKEQEIILDEDNDASVVLEKVKKMKEQLKQCQQEKQDNLTGWQRAQADFINYRRRQEEQMNEWSNMFGEGLIKDLLPVLDTLDASVEQTSTKEKTTSPQPSPSTCASPKASARQEGEGEIPPNLPFTKGGVEGLKMTREQLMKILSKHGLMEMKVVGEKFNPELHEAVETMEAENKNEGVVVEEVQKGYLLNGKVIRVAKVKVSK